MRGQSKAVGVLLMVGVALVLVAGLGVFVFDITGGNDEPAVVRLDITPTEAGSGVVIEHANGDTMNTEDMRIIIEDRFAATEFDAAARLDTFSAGDQLVADERILSGQTEVTVIFEPANSIIAEETLRLGGLFELTGNATFELPGRGARIPAEGINVTAERNGSVLRSAETDENGEFGLTEVPNGTDLKMNGELVRQDIEPSQRAAVELVNDTDTIDNASGLPGFLMENLADSGRPQYAVETASDLQTMTVSSARYRLVTDIDASHTAVWDGGRGFVPIEDNPDLKGQGHVINGLTIDRPDRNQVGLFGSTTLSDKGFNVPTIRNVGLENVDITGNNGTGALVGTAGRPNSANIENSYATGTVRGDELVGGLVGTLGPGRTIEGSYADVDVSGTTKVGGLLGAGGGKYSVVDSYAVGRVSGNSSVGGLVGSGRLGFRFGTVPGPPQPDDGQIERSFAAGSVSGMQDVGGLLGRRASDNEDGSGTSFTDAYWDIEVTGQTEAVGNSTNGGATGLNTTEMQGAAASNKLGGFDFGNTWETVPGDYPTLQVVTADESGTGGG